MEISHCGPYCECELGASVMIGVREIWIRDLARLGVSEQQSAGPRFGEAGLIKW